MQQNINPYNNQMPLRQAPMCNPNAVNINIFQPQAYGNGADTCAQTQTQNYYPLYQQNQNPALPLYPMNYNNMIQYPNSAQKMYQGATGQNQAEPNPYLNNPYAANPYSAQNQYPQGNNSGYLPNGTQNGAGNSNGYLPPEAQYGTGNSGNNGNVGDNTNGMNGANGANAYNSTNLVEKTKNESASNSKSSEETKKKDEKEKTVTILTDDYIKTLENYLNNSNPKMRLIAAKEVMERFKEDDSRISNPSLNALLNKILRDTSPSVRFLGLTTLQLGYSIGNDETVSILKEIQQTNKDKLGEDALLASEILLKMTAPKVKEVK